MCFAEEESKSGLRQRLVSESSSVHSVEDVQVAIVDKEIKKVVRHDKLVVCLINTGSKFRRRKFQKHL